MPQNGTELFSAHSFRNFQRAGMMEGERSVVKESLLPLMIGDDRQIGSNQNE
jgi:hypothetical protein